MKFMHLADLHIGRRLNEFSMIEDQKYILNRIINIAAEQEVEGIIIAGDVYDRSIPSIEAIEIFENFVEELVKLKIPAYIVSGNHDSCERLSAFSNLISHSGIYISKTYNEKIEPIIYKNTAIWLLPFIRPADVRRYHPDIEIGNYEDAVKKVIDTLDIDESMTNIIAAHQFVTANGEAPELSDSEVSSLGTLDNVDFTVFDKFDYAALGHIHKPQSMGRKEVRYSGSPLKYSFSEVNQKKSVSIIEINKKHKINIETYPLEPLHDMREIKGSLIELLKEDKTEDYMHITLTDMGIIDAKSKLETVFPNIMKLDFEEYNIILEDNKSIEKIKEKNIIEYFCDFFKKQTGQEISAQNLEMISELLESSQGDNK